MRFIKPSLVILLLLALKACTTGSNNSVLSKYFNTSNLTEQLFTINTRQDTTVTTKQGIRIHIAANAIDAGTAANVTLTVKEALTLENILKSGLTTTTNGEMLASDGMFYINTKEKATIVKPLQAFLPTAVVNNKMQLYRGEEKNGEMNWVEPAKTGKPTTYMTDSGEVLFKANCAGCHAVTKEATGPALAWEDKKKSLQWLRDFTRNTGEVMRRGDKYACCIFSKYKSVMTIFDSLLNDHQIDAIYRYIDKVSAEESIPMPICKELTACDSCNYYHDYFYKLARARDSLVKDNGPMVKFDFTLPPTNVVVRNDMAESDLVEEKTFSAEYYQLEIKAFGWLNVDTLVSGWPNLATSNLKVKLANAGTGRMEVFMIVPAYKVFQRGGLLDDNTNYGFYKNDGTVNLMQGENTIVFAIGEEKGKIYFGETPFAASLSQNIVINVHESNKKEIERFFKNAHAEDIKMDVEKSKNYKDIKAIDKELGNARQALANCSCMEAAPVSSDTTYEK